MKDVIGRIVHHNHNGPLQTDDECLYFGAVKYEYKYKYRIVDEHGSYSKSSWSDWTKLSANKFVLNEKKKGKEISIFSTQSRTI